MKLKINPYNKKALERFDKEKSRILKTIGNFEIHHIGSTAIPGLGGKGIVDILIGIDNWKQAKEIIKKLKEVGFFHIHQKERGRIFLSKNTSLSLNNVHIHIVIKQNKAYRNILFFRDYLRKNKEEAGNYYNLKKAWLKESSGNREKYSSFKNKYINKILKNDI